MDFGISLAADPDNAKLPELAIRATTMNSPWHARTCKVCKNKFREGDQVRVCPGSCGGKCGEPYHDDHQYGLHCWQKHFGSDGGKQCSEGGKDRFSESGRDAPACPYTWDGHLPDEPPTKGSSGQGPSPRIQPAEPMVSQFVSGVEAVWRPFGSQRVRKVSFGSSLVGRNCPWCRFRVRAGDSVVECPCEIDCGTYFHQDVFRHLTCWNEWNGVAGNDYCPTTGAPYRRTAEGREGRGD